MLGNHCNGATDLKTKFETEDLVKVKQWNALDDQKKGFFFTVSEPFQKIYTQV